MEKQFATGMRVSLPRQGAPSFVMGSLNIKVSDFIEFLKKHEKNNGYVDIDLKIGKSGSPYAELNTWTPNKPARVEEDNRMTSPSEDFPNGLSLDDMIF
jgi:hypothetical protein